MAHCLFVSYWLERCVRKTHPLSQRCRDRADWQRWKCRVKCVRRRSQQARVLSASPAAGAGRHTWHSAQALPADVSLVSQLCVCARVCLRHRHPPAHSVKRATCVITLPPPTGISVSHPFPILLFSLPLPSLWWTRWVLCHHDMIWQNVTLHTCRLPGDGGASSADQMKGWTEDGEYELLELQDRQTSGETADTRGNRVTEWERGEWLKHAQVSRRKEVGDM